MNKLFLTLLLTAITVTSIKPAEQPQPNNSWLRTACITGAAVVGLGSYAWATGAREKKKRLKGYRGSLALSEKLLAVPGAGRWNALDSITGGLAYIHINCLFILGANSLMSSAFGTRDFTPTSITKNSKLLALSVIPLLLISELAEKRADTFKGEYRKTYHVSDKN